jgi:hypothetical protein
MTWKQFWHYYVRLYFSKALWCSWLMLGLLALHAFGVITSEEQSFTRFFLGLFAIAFVGGIFALVGLWIGWDDYKRLRNETH